MTTKQAQEKVTSWKLKPSTNFHTYDCSSYYFWIENIFLSGDFDFLLSGGGRGAAWVIIM